MAELEVVTKYTSWPARTIVILLVFSMPLWGIFVPLIMLFGLWQLLVDPSSIFRTPQALFSYLGIMLGLAVLPICGVLATLAFGDDRIVASRSGLRLPFFLALGTMLQRNFEWSQIEQVALSGDASQALSRLHLIFITKRKKRVKLRLSAIREADVEQLLLASDVWCTEATKDSRLEDLSRRISASSASDNDENRKLSYTAMWEEEMERHFTSTAFMPLEPGLSLQNGRLRVVRQLSFGGLSAIYLCQDAGKELVVLKESVIPADSKPEIKKKAEELFAREAQLLMKLNHPNIVRVLDYFVENGRNYMLLEYISGQDLRQVVRQHGPQKEVSVVDWALTLCDVLIYLHKQEPAIIHRDLTPDNIVLRDDGTIKLIDFGAANEFIGTATGTLVGKQAYISPEQLRGKPTTASDIYGLGCTLHYLFTGADPEPLSVSSPAESGAKVSANLNQLVTECTDMDSSGRPSPASIKERLATAAKS